MIHAYDYDMMPRAQKQLGWMFDAGINFYKMQLEHFYHLFLNSDISKKIAYGDAGVIMGKSGKECAYDILAEHNPSIPRPDYHSMDRGQAFWLGWALSYYQWDKGIIFSQITEKLSIREFWDMYDKYHEMDISHFVDEVDEMRERAQDMSRLKRIRQYAGLSQRELADLSGVPLRTIQQYEQRAKDINKANVDYVVSLSKVLKCEVAMLLEEF